MVGKNVGVEVYEHGTQKPYKTALEAIKVAEKKGLDTLIVDTAGRLHINDDLMRELEDIEREINPTEILLTVDAMTGQDAVTVATTFNERLNISGVILTKLDGDTRGGAALSIRSVTGKPIKFCGIGEKMGDIEPFHPERMASRILGMGDVLTLIEKAQNAVTEEEMQKLEKKFRESNFSLDDFLTQIDSISKMGDLSQLISMMPNMGNIKLSEKDIDEKRVARFKAIIQSMTMYEREHPEIIKSSRRRRIAAGSGTSIQDVNQLLKQFEQSKEMMRAMKGGRRLPFRR